MVSMEIVVGFLGRDNYDPEQNLILQQCKLDFSKKNDATSGFELWHISDERLGTSTQNWRWEDSGQNTLSSEKFSPEKKL